MVANMINHFIQKCGADGVAMLFQICGCKLVVRLHDLCRKYDVVTKLSIIISKCITLY